jgi:hypothetical protein
MKGAVLLSRYAARYTVHYATCEIKNMTENRIHRFIKEVIEKREHTIGDQYEQQKIFNDRISNPNNVRFRLCRK